MFKFFTALKRKEDHSLRHEKLPLTQGHASWNRLRIGAFLIAWEIMRSNFLRIAGAPPKVIGLSFEAFSSLLGDFVRCQYYMIKIGPKACCLGISSQPLTKPRQLDYILSPSLPIFISIIYSMIVHCWQYFTIIDSEDEYEKSKHHQ